MFLKKEIRLHLNTVLYKKTKCIGRVPHALRSFILNNSSPGAP